MDQSMYIGGLACVKKTASPCCRSYNNLRGGGHSALVQEVCEDHPLIQW